jgi:choline dehydrogenase-like flavoprotein
MDTPSMRAVDARLAGGPLQSCADQHGYLTDDYWRCYIRFGLKTVWHSAGTCKMGGYYDPTTVVDSRLR